MWAVSRAIPYQVSRQCIMGSPIQSLGRAQCMYPTGSPIRRTTHLIWRIPPWAAQCIPYPIYDSSYQLPPLRGSSREVTHAEHNAPRWSFSSDLPDTKFALRVVQNMYRGKKFAGGKLNSELHQHSRSYHPVRFCLYDGSSILRS